MIHQDYVMRQVTQFIQVLLHVLGLTKKKRYQAALDAIDQAFQELAGLSLDSAISISGSALIGFLVGVNVYEGREKCLMAATLFKEAGTIHAAQGRFDESYECYLKALTLLLEVLLDEDKVALPDYAPSVSELAAELKGYVLPVETSTTLFRYYERTGAYAEAEDTLFEMIGAEADNADIIKMGIAFYERLKQKDDKTLLAGNLPRNEVEDGWAELLTYQAVGQHDTDAADLS